MVTQQTKSHEWEPELIKMALKKVDDLIDSTNKLTIISAELQVTMANFQVKWQDVREEVSRDRHAAKGQFTAIQTIHENFDERISLLEEDKKLFKAEKELKDKLKKEEENRKKKQFNRVYAIITLIISLFGYFHWRNLKDLLSFLF